VQRPLHFQEVHELKTFLRQCLPFLALLSITTLGFADSGAEFKTRCAPCHGEKGSGDTKLGQHLQVPDLGSPEVQNQSDAQLTEVISKGKGKMPANEGRLSKDQINDLVKYIRMLKK
jgi:mono/diheme cytochrome c family protein